MNDKWIFASKFALFIFMTISLITIVISFILPRDNALAGGYLIALVICEVVNLIIAIIEEPLIRWLT